MKNKREVENMIKRLNLLRNHPYWWGGSSDSSVINAMIKILNWVIGEEKENNLPFMDTIKQMENGTYTPSDT